ncbi:MAG: hypothetical protein EZS28_038707 [Streblomastix strix]|uniref:Uncharacterized protein n=1 Tax=Streblomastix strix TaxID=222440 RepID=A0A5J4U4R2_9EUKA|nr:MAG: hypothetical protein EZS28_038707 [Streblomastix strix]
MEPQEKGKLPEIEKIQEKTIESISYIICAQIKNTYELDQHPYYKVLHNAGILNQIFGYLTSAEQKTNETRAYAAVILGLVYQGIQIPDGMINQIMFALANQLNLGSTEKLQTYILETLYVIARLIS